MPRWMMTDDRWEEGQKILNDITDVHFNHLLIYYSALLMLIATFIFSPKNNEKIMMLQWWLCSVHHSFSRHLIMLMLRKVKISLQSEL